MKKYEIGDEFELDGVKLRCEERIEDSCKSCYGQRNRCMDLKLGDFECTDFLGPFGVPNFIFVEVQNG